MTSEELELLLLASPTPSIIQNPAYGVPPEVQAYGCLLHLVTPQTVREWLPRVLEAQSSEEMYVTRVGVLLSTTIMYPSPMFSARDSSTWGPECSWEVWDTATDALENMDDTHAYKSCWSLCHHVIPAAYGEIPLLSDAFFAADPSLLPLRRRPYYDPNPT